MFLDQTDVLVGQRLALLSVHQVSDLRQFDVSGIITLYCKFNLVLLGSCCFFVGIHCQVAHVVMEFSSRFISSLLFIIVLIKTVHQALWLIVRRLAVIFVDVIFGFKAHRVGVLSRSVVEVIIDLSELRLLGLLLLSFLRRLLDGLSVVGGLGIPSHGAHDPWRPLVGGVGGGRHVRIARGVVALHHSLSERVGGGGIHLRLHGAIHCVRH